MILHQDILISLLGYVAAALGGALAASGFGHRQKSAVGAPALTTASKASVSPKASVASAKITDVLTSRSRRPSDELPTVESSARRNRQETISLAREMLAKGTSHDRIKRVLPVSDGELILLQKTPNRDLRDKEAHR